jgi:pilus assembly protein Flp/PilA
VRRLISGFVCDTRGATSIEYALIAVGLSIVILGAVTSIGSALNGKYTAVKDALK